MDTSLKHISIFLFLSLVGCVGNTDQLYLLPQAVPLIDEPFNQWVEVKPIFPNDNNPAIVIKCKVFEPTVFDWETHTILWLEGNEGYKIGYNGINIQVYYNYEADSGPDTIERKYWPIDINDDGLDDILVLEWNGSNKGRYIINDNGKEIYKYFKYDEPTGIRLIQREEYDGTPIGVEYDQQIKWSRVEKFPIKHISYFKESLLFCESNVWEKRLLKAIKILEIAVSANKTN